MSQKVPRKLLLIAYVWPEPSSSAAGVRDLALLRLFRDAGWRVACASSSRPNDFMRALSEREGIETREIAMNDSSADRELGDLAPDAVIFDRFVTEEQFGWRVREIVPDAARIIDTQDLHSLRRGRERALLAGASVEAVESLRFDLAGEDLMRELAAIHRSDLSLVLSSFERALLVSRLGVAESQLELSPFLYPPAPPSSGFNERSGFVMIGNFRHPPNADAVKWLRREIWPYIRKRLPKASVHVYGAYPSREMMDLSDAAEAFEVRGWAPDLAATLNAYRVSLAPLRYGAGLKGKIADSWWSGLPVVTTPIGAEGMRGDRAELAFGGAIAREPDDFAAQAVRLHEDATEWELARRHGSHILSEVHDGETGGARLLNAVSRLCDELRRRRERNVTGEILWHQLHRSTEYFSRWIELKEANQRSLKEAR